MSYSRTLLLSLFVAACSQADPPSGATLRSEGGDDVRAEFLRMANGDPWAKWPDGDWLHGNLAEDGQPCERVSEQFREVSVGRLTEAPAVAVDAREYKHLTGAAPPAIDGTFWLLRGFSTTGSAARVKVTGNAVTVYSHAMGGLFDLRRHPCIAVLRSGPSEVYTVVDYDL